MDNLWTDEYGSPTIPNEWEWFYAHSPNHHGQTGIAYPTVLIYRATNGPRRSDARPKDDCGVATSILVYASDSTSDARSRGARDGKGNQPMVG